MGQKGTATLSSARRRAYNALTKPTTVERTHRSENSARFWECGGLPPLWIWPPKLQSPTLPVMMLNVLFSFFRIGRLQMLGVPLDLLSGPKRDVPEQRRFR